MHILLGLLGAIVTILILLNRLADAGIDLGGLNPFLWARRRKWKNSYEGDPIYKVEDPMELTALLMVALAKCDGDMSAEEKRLILGLFENEFNLSKRDASGLMVSSVYLLKDGNTLRNNLDKVLTPSLDKFTRDQTNSAISLFEQVAGIEQEGNPLKQELFSNIQSAFSDTLTTQGKWA